ncbi:hypothetical protein BO70DRAFT_427693 [Aspergillus heteromorphus CBS 117.55]|uniref:Mitochondrial ATPase inhibitor n=1 Tax=Aspergillus heteromorphus CBS 117.55 TaxID=1448321 RepID=A0A317WJM5_9EURO|nr:uncharacterized protein BO70DRAFT_427693 [Aspergillus heteromorphus CBS 117.55]PWY86654.1 hypothetical protein BO70DRAFT_427693 [Aspergillus heteromorphus CBS 117.55]
MSHLIRAGSIARLARPFSIIVPARREGEAIFPKPCGFLADIRPESSGSYPGKTQEVEKFMVVRQKMHEQRRHLDELERHIQDLAREQDGGIPGVIPHY